MAASGRTTPTAEAELRPGAGRKVRREYALRALVAVVLAVAFAAIGVYGAHGVTTCADSGVPFLVFGVAGALAQFALALAFLSARAAIDGDRYRKPAVTRARRFRAFVFAAEIPVGAAVGLGWWATRRLSARRDPGRGRHGAP